MALVEIKVPSVGESVTEALLAEWFKQDGETVRRDEALFVLETDKVTLEVMAESTGKLAIQVAAGTTVAIGQVVGTIDTEAAGKGQTAAAEPARAAGSRAAAEAPRAPAPAPPPVERPAAAPPPAEAAPEKEPPAKPGEPESPAPPAPEGVPPSVRRLAAEYDLDLSRIRGSGPSGRITKGDVLLHIESAKTAPATATPAGEAPDRRPGLPSLRGPGGGDHPQADEPDPPAHRRAAAQGAPEHGHADHLQRRGHERRDRAAFRYKESFQKKHGVSFGFMSFFVKASRRGVEGVSPRSTPSSTARTSSTTAITTSGSRSEPEGV
jgi:2-oxoglutarate dehydrogenase E2 component (dihydrolipoamide succinyltransferase)